MPGWQPQCLILLPRRMPVAACKEESSCCECPAPPQVLALPGPSMYQCGRLADRDRTGRHRGWPEACRALPSPLLGPSLCTDSKKTQGSKHLFENLCGNLIWCCLRNADTIPGLHGAGRGGVKGSFTAHTAGPAAPVTACRGCLLPAPLCSSPRRAAG